MPLHNRHEAFPYTGRDQFVPACASLVHDGFERDDRVIVFATQDKVDDIRDELGAQAEDVTLVPTDEHGRNPSRITAMLHSFSSGGDGRRSLGVNETALLGRSAAGRAEAGLADFLLNDPALRSWPLSIVCLFDMSVLDDVEQRAMRQSHAVLHGDGENPDYLPDLAVSVFSQLLDPPPAQARRMTVRTGQLVEMRGFVRDVAAGYPIGADRVDDLVLAANEVVTNSLRFGRGRCELAAWFEDGSVVCDVRDRGRINDPLVGRIAPPTSATSGRGLWLVNHLCDLVQIRSSSRGTVVRLFVDR
jgi:anti-sigma regulatory factor (Ser/Thr protein kinase)